MEPDFGKLPDGLDRILVKKQLNDFLKQAQKDSKTDKCIVCGKSTTSFCNSHSVPRVYLKNIAENGKVMQANGLLRVEALDDLKGVNNSGTFRLICNECDSKLFHTYEDPQNIKANELPDNLLAEIALKDVILMLSKRNVERAIYQKASEQGNFSGLETVFESQNLDVRDFKNEMDLYLNITDTASNSFQIVYHQVLPYTTPIAVQTPLVIQKDLEGNVINDIYDFSPEIRMQYMHVAIFPLERETVVLMFYHRRDKNYRRFLHQFNCLDSEDKLRYINYQIFKCTENYFLAPSIKHIIDENPKLIQLSRENDELPNLGNVTIFDIMNYQPVKIEDIPNLLSPQYALGKSEGNRYVEGWGGEGGEAL